MNAHTQSRNVYLRNLCHATATMHIFPVTAVLTKAVDLQAAAGAQIRALSTLPTLAGHDASLEAQAEAGTYLTPLQIILLLTRLIQLPENAVLCGNKIYRFIISHKMYNIYTYIF